MNEENFRDNHWYSFFAPTLDKRLESSKSSRVLILWGTNIKGISTLLSDKRQKIDSIFGFQAESRRVENLKKKLKQNCVTFQIYDLRKCIFEQDCLATNDINERVNERYEATKQIIRNFHPTTIVFAFSSEEFGEYPMLDLDKVDDEIHFEETYNKLDIVQQLHKDLMIQSVVHSNQGFMIFQTRNIAENEVCFLSFITSNCQPGIMTSITDTLDEILLVAGMKAETKILIISGSSGTSRGKISGFTNQRLLKHDMYQNTCELVGIDSEGKNSDSIPKPTSQIQSKYARTDALMINPKYKNMKFLVLNIKHFVIVKQTLGDFVNKYNPNAIIIDWPFSKDGDVANYLCTSGILPELRLTLDRTSIVGVNHNWIKLDENQRRVLRDVADLIKREKEQLDGSECLTRTQKDNIKLRHVVLFGGHGTGKTILGIEVVKMFMAKIRQEQSEIKSTEMPNLFVFDTKSYHKSQLLYQLENMFQHEDGCEKKLFWHVKDFEKESGIKVKDPKNTLRFVKEFVAKISNENSAQKSIILMDEVDGRSFSEESTSSERIKYKTPKFTSI